MSRYLLLVVVLATLLAACNGKSPSLPKPTTGLVLPDIQLATSLPNFRSEQNEIQIADSFNDVDPSWVIGALVNVKTQKVYPLDSYLKAGLKPVITPQTQIVFKNFIENSVAVNAQWLEFVKGEVSDTTRAEVLVTKTSKITIDSQSVNKELLLKQLAANQITSKEDIGVIIGYTNYVLSASYFRTSGVDGNVSGYGAKIGGKWYNKTDNSTLQHRIVAVWSPLPFVIDTIDKKIAGDLSAITSKALVSGALKVEKLSIPAELVKR